jgi:hypothetical protein
MENPRTCPSKKAGSPVSGGRQIRSREHSSNGEVTPILATFGLGQGAYLFKKQAE